jgi:hypothetical protein
VAAAGSRAGSRAEGEAEGEAALDGASKGSPVEEGADTAADATRDGWRESSRRSLGGKAATHALLGGATDSVTELVLVSAESKKMVVVTLLAWFRLWFTLF